MYKDKIRISDNNTHLLNIFTDNCYLELGSIDYVVLSKLLDGRTLRIEDLIDFNIQRIGIGNISLNNQNLQRMIPILNFFSLSQKNQTIQLFITHGIFISKDQHNKEIFTPILLIPVMIFFENDSILVKIMGRPIENKILFNYLHTKKIDISLNEKIKDIYDMDKFCFSLGKMNSRIEMENFLTFAGVVYPPIIINHEQFSLKNVENVCMNCMYYVNDEFELYNITKLNNYQRNALLKAHFGNSFAIMGPGGTGKTTTLLNIAADAIYNGKKVLYISNNKKTLDFVEGEYVKRGLKNVVVNLTYRSRYNRNMQIEVKDVANIKALKKELLDKYHTIFAYEKFLSGRVHNFLFSEVLSSLLTISNPDIDYEIDEVKELYKAEYEEIMASLNYILERLSRPFIFKESKFINIPLNNVIKYPNQIISLLFQLHKLFSELDEQRINLEEHFGFKHITNFARFKNVINAFINMDPMKIPLSWKMEPHNEFLNAKDHFLDFKGLIYAYQDIKLDLDWDFNDLEHFDIDDCINALLGKFFTEKDGDKIDRVLDSYKDLINRVKGGVYNTKLFNKSIKSVKKVMDWNFDENDNNVIEDIVKMTTFLSTSVFHPIWLNENKKVDIRNEIFTLQEKLKRFTFLEKQYFKYFPSFEEIDKNISYLQKVVETKKIPMRFRGVNLELLIKEIEEYRTLKGRIKKYDKRYIELTGFAFSSNYDILYDFDKYYEFINAVSNADSRRKIVRFLSNNNEEEMEIKLQDFNNFVRSFNIINQIYEYIKPFFPTKEINNYIKRTHFLVEVNKYLNRVRITDELMQNLIKHKKVYVGFDTYLDVRKKLQALDNLNKQVVENKNYPLWYGELYKGVNSNINDIASLLNSYNLYLENFHDLEKAIFVLDMKNYLQVREIITTSLKITNDIGEAFKLYSKIFKDGIGSYYYDDFSSVINYLDSLLHAKDDLKTYLEITDSLKVLSKYHLTLMIDALINNRYDNIMQAFQYKYFRALYEEYMNKYRNIPDSGEMQQIVADTVLLEEQLCQHHIYEIYVKKGTKETTSVKPYLDLSRPLTLSTTSILNNLLDYRDFDLILIDDAHLQNANEYYNAVLGTQVIIAGEEFNHPLNPANLLMRMRSNNIMKFHFRYTPTPLKLLSSLHELKGMFLPKVSENYGVEVISRDIIKYMGNLYLQNKDLIVNVYTSDFFNAFTIHNGLAQILIENGFTENEIYDIITKKLNVCDLFSGYSYESDYNILVLSDYYQIKSDFLSLENIHHLLLCKKLIILDNNNILRNETNTLFVSLLTSLLDNKLEIFNIDITPLLLKLGSTFNKYGIIVHGSYEDMGLMLEYNNTYYGILFFANPKRNHVEILEEYREYYLGYRHNNIKVYIIWIVDLLTKYDEVLQEIVKGILG